MKKILNKILWWDATHYICFFAGGFFFHHMMYAQSLGEVLSYLIVVIVFLFLSYKAKLIKDELEEKYIEVESFQSKT